MYTKRPNEERHNPGTLLRPYLAFWSRRLKGKYGRLGVQPHSFPDLRHMNVITLFSQKQIRKEVILTNKVRIEQKLVILILRHSNAFRKDDIILLVRTAGCGSRGFAASSASPAFTHSAQLDLHLFPDMTLTYKNKVQLSQHNIIAGAAKVINYSVGS